jgi:outer membrane protein assembly factor BamB
VVFTTEGWDAEVLAAVGDRQMSIENSVAMAGSVVFFTNSAGLVQGWDLAPLRDGGVPERVFRFWSGDDTDASLVIDDDGMVYVASEYERGNARSRELGQIIKLDPSRPDDPVVWSREGATRLGGGVWATPAIWGALLIVPTDDGRVLGIDRVDGATRWTLELPGPLWSSPVVVDDVLVQGDCAGVLHAFDLGSTERPLREPRKRWSVPLGGCIESTPAVWDGRVHVGTRAGTFFTVGDAPTADTLDG